MAPLPLLKLFGLFVKTLAKPVASRMKKDARKFERFSNLCVSIGQLLHQGSSRVTAFASGFKIKEINPLSEEDALARGISFLSETMVFSVAGGIIIIEFVRSEQKNAEKAEQTKQKEAEFRQYLEDKFDSLDRRLTALESRVERIEHGKLIGSKPVYKQTTLPAETVPAAKTKEGQSLWQWAWAYIDRTHQPSLPTISDNTSDSNSIFSSSSNSSSGGEGSSSPPPALQG